MIVRDEEKYIEQCLQKLKPLGYEIIVVDTGSVDRTKEIASVFTDKIYEFTWVNDFAAARNFSIEKATNDYVLIVDSDEMLIQFDKKKLEKLVKDNKNGVGTITRINEFTRKGNVFRAHEQVPRLFNRNYYQYEGIIHEQIIAKEIEEKYFYEIPLTAEHYGYEGNLEVRRKKTQRNIALLEEQLVHEKEEKSDEVPYILYQLGKSYYMQEDYKKANEYFEEALYYDLDPHLVYVQDMVESYGNCLLEAKEYETALNLLGVYEEFAISTDFVFLAGLIYMNNGCLTEAVQEFEKATSRKTCKTEGVNSYMAWYNLGVIYECAGNREKAIEYYEKCGRYKSAIDGLNRLK